MNINSYKHQIVRLANDEKALKLKTESHTLYNISNKYTHTAFENLHFKKNGLNLEVYLSKKAKKPSIIFDSFYDENQDAQIGAIDFNGVQHLYDSSVTLGAASSIVLAPYLDESDSKAANTSSMGDSAANTSSSTQGTAVEANTTTTASQDTAAQATASDTSHDFVGMWPWVLGGGLGLAAGAFALSHSGSGGGSASSSTPTATEIKITGMVVAGQILSGNDLHVQAYKSDGSMLGTSVNINSDGSFSLIVNENYTGPILLKVINSGTHSDYMDETIQSPVDLGSVVLRATYNINGSGSYVINITPLTEIATQVMGIDVLSTTPNVSQSTITSINNTVSSAFNISNIITTAPNAVNSGNFNDTKGVTPSDVYGLVLATLSAVDQRTGSTNTTNTLLASQINISNSTLSQNALCLMTIAAKNNFDTNSNTYNNYTHLNLINSDIDNGGAANTPILSLSEVEAIQNSVLNSISNCAQNNNATATTPALIDYLAAGVTGVDASNLAAISSALNSAAVNASAADTTAEVQAIVDAVNVVKANADATANNYAINPTQAQYTLMGVIGVDSTAKENLLGDVIDAKAYSSVDSTPEIQALADAVAAVMSAAAGGTAPTLAQLQALGVSGVTADNLPAVLAAIAASADDGSGVDTLSELQTLVSTAAVAAANALNTISSAAQNDTAGTTPALADFIAAGVTGVDASNLAAISSALNSAAVNASAADTTAEVQLILAQVMANSLPLCKSKGSGTTTGIVQVMAQTQGLTTHRCPAWLVPLIMISMATLTQQVR